ncbi:hypothetical protein [Ruania zhangjianzhongii]|uniref:hypothetical protein n=1 Tax=Ruania zhangjianzhongii TaxID=2603206 RepID=UPI00143CF91F|nr:hypothetical protein [Ruania zhangjianzhongii]
MTQNPPDQPGGQPGPYGSPEQFGAGDSQPYGAPGQQPQQGGEYPYGAGQQQSYGAAPAGQPDGASAAQQPYGPPAPAQSGSGGPDGPGGPDGTGPNQPGGPAGPPPGGRRSNAGVIAGIVIGGLLVLALLIWGAITLIDGRDDTIPTPTPTATDPSTDGSADADSEPTDDATDESTDDSSGTDAGGGELYDLLSTEAAEVAGDSGNTWTIQGDWADASDLSADAMEAYTATYSSDAGEITMTAISFPDSGAADTYVAGVQDERGDPDYSGDVWQSDNGNGLGTRIDYDGDVYSVYWYDDSAVVYQIDAPDADTAQSFYGSLPF